jgi:hypothetical protein
MMRVFLSFPWGSRLRSLIYFFFELCLLRKAPQDLPASSALLAVTLVADMLSAVLLAHAAGISPVLGLAQSLVDVVLMLSLLYGGLSWARHPARFTQAATALLGSGALLGIFAIVPLELFPVDTQSQGSPVGALLFIGIIGWSVLVIGHIVRHAFALRLTQGVAISVAYNLLVYWLVGILFATY